MLGSNNPSAYLLGNNSRIFSDESFSDDYGKEENLAKKNLIDLHFFLS
jgi:hypothetical protein